MFPNTITVSMIVFLCLSLSPSGGVNCFPYQPYLDSDWYSRQLNPFFNYFNKDDPKVEPKRISHKEIYNLDIMDTTITSTSSSSASNNDEISHGLPVDSQREYSSNRDVDWKMIILFFSCVFAILFSIRCLFELIPQICDIRYPPRGTTMRTIRRRQGGPPVHLMTGYTAARRGIMNLGVPPPPRSSLNRSQNRNSATATSQKVPLSCNRNGTGGSEAARFLASSSAIHCRNDERPKCETPPPPYSPTMAQRNMGEIV